MSTTAWAKRILATVTTVPMKPAVAERWVAQQLDTLLQEAGATTCAPPKALRIPKRARNDTGPSQRLIRRLTALGVQVHSLKPRQAWRGDRRPKEPAWLAMVTLPGQTEPVEIGSWNTITACASGIRLELDGTKTRSGKPEAIALPHEPRRYKPRAPVPAEEAGQT